MVLNNKRKIRKEISYTLRLGKERKTQKNEKWRKTFKNIEQSQEKKPTRRKQNKPHNVLETKNQWIWKWSD